jgi:hypothetical protein
MQQQKGYIALTSVLVIAAIVFLTSVAVAWFAINQVQSSLSFKKSSEAEYLLESCVEQVLLDIKNNNEVSQNIILPEIACQATVENHQGNDWQILISGSFENYTHQIRLTLNSRPQIVISNWQKL